ncbi:hypothetical protein T11_5095 [Trichinella zimbabwensis]|uniref:Uncharacterized protein n=1 Tax=Trichinella zimbabwensis TaxID=268475 RepID=A0A0V1I3V9_9BILA|nr:hypothetical protein T11_5095 [Trichinella zimbabwensis]
MSSIRCFSAINQHRYKSSKANINVIKHATKNHNRVVSVISREETCIGRIAKQLMKALQFIKANDNLNKIIEMISIFWKKELRFDQHADLTKTFSSKKQLVKMGHYILKDLGAIDEPLNYMHSVLLIEF